MSRVLERHRLLEATIGTLPEEKVARNTCVLLASILPIGLLLCFLLQIALFLLYNFKLHPWAKIIQQDGEQEQEKKEEGEEKKQDGNLDETPQQKKKQDAVDVSLQAKIADVKVDVV